jgi:cytochrome c-type biogenesis protein CcmH/NrfG
MASKRGKQHLKRRPDAHAPVRHSNTPSRAAARRARKIEEEGMFFPRLRNHAKWVFVLLALLFALGFVFFGVGSGSNGIGDVLQDWLHIGQASTGPSTSKLEKKTAEEPRNAKAWRDLATAYETDQRTDDAVRALERLTALTPKDADTLQELAGQYQRQLQNLSVEAGAAQAAGPGVDVTNFQPPATTALGRAFQSPGALQDPLTAALAAQASTAIGELQTKGRAIQQKLLTTDKRVVALDPTNPTAQFQLAQVADSTGDTAAALAAYRRFLKLSPDDPLAPQVRQRVKQLSAPATTTSG